MNFDRLSIKNNQSIFYRFDLRDQAGRALFFIFEGGLEATTRPVASAANLSKPATLSWVQKNAQVGPFLTGDSTQRLVASVYKDQRS